LIYGATSIQFFEGQKQGVLFSQRVPMVLQTDGATAVLMIQTESNVKQVLALLVQLSPLAQTPRLQV